MSGSMLNPYLNPIPGMIRNRLAKAMKFTKPPNFYERARLRNALYRESGPFENPIKRFVRLREKARIFSVIPPPRKIPVPKPAEVMYIRPVQCVPNVSPEVLERRLEFLLSDKAIKQQLYAKLRPGITPYETERRVWEQQMVELRRIYRTQYLQKLALVTNEERLKQIEYMQRLYRARRNSELRQQNVLYEDRRRRALLQDQHKLRHKVYESIGVVKRARKSSRLLRHYRDIEGQSNFITPGNVQTEINENDRLMDRNVSIPKMLNQLGLSSDDDLVAPILASRSTDLYKEILEESFRYLPEDEDIIGHSQKMEAHYGSTMTERQRAHVTYQHFSESEKLKLVDQKIRIVKEKLSESQFILSKGGKDIPNTSLWTHLLDQLEATKAAHLEKLERRQKK